MARSTYDAVVIGGGPTGAAAALALASSGASVLVLEANPRASERLAGEWLHPKAVDVMQRLGVELEQETPYPTGAGFVVFPEDGSSPIELPYTSGRIGKGIRHERLVTALRRRVSENPAIDSAEHARVVDVDGQRIMYREASGATSIVRSQRIIGAAGRRSVLHRALGIDASSATYSRMAGVVLLHTSLPFEGFGHVFLGADGPILAYRVGEREVRLCLDVPLTLRREQEWPAVLFETYAPALPSSLREPFQRALSREPIEWATNQTRLRRHYGRPGLALAGDAVGHHHPFTAAGLTLGFEDAVAVAESPTFDAYRAKRRTASRVPELLAIALYDVFAGAKEDSVRVRDGTYAFWRKSEENRRRTMALLSCDETNVARFGVTLSRVLGLSLNAVVADGGPVARWSHKATVLRDLGRSVGGWVASGGLHLREARPAPPLRGVTVDSTAGAGIDRETTRIAPQVAPQRRSREARPDTTRALHDGLRALIALQDDDGSWEGEVVWCAVLAAEYVLTWHLMDLPMDPLRKKRVLLHFERSRLEDGLWGLSTVGESSLFVTTLVYVAARILGVAAHEEWLAPARKLFATEAGVRAIPTWGKFWLAMLSLYDWNGVNPVIPELWAMPESVPVHPSRYYCHTRLIYLAMATLYAERFKTSTTPLLLELREELYPTGFGRVDFKAARKELREKDLFAKPTLALEASYEVLRVVDRFRSSASRKKLLAELRDAMRWDLKASEHTAISPVSGLLSILALWSHDREDPDAKLAVERFDCWVWEDDRDGTRVAGARSAIWDTSFALQTLRVAEPSAKVRRALSSGAAFLESQQIRATFPGYRENHRVDPAGGYPVSWKWHGWAVSDCTAEAMLGRLEAPNHAQVPDEDVVLAATFILRLQGTDGGFGSYEPRRVPFSLEWLNPAEMFGDSMTEAGYVECTASCVAALARIAADRPHLLRRPALQRVPVAIREGASNIRRQQLANGSWPGAWGVRFIYGTWFGVRGLLAAGAPTTDPAIRKACAWLKSRQRADGGWGERFEPHGTEYAEHLHSQVVQTAWALMTLCEASDPDWPAIERAAGFLSSAQLGNGEWPRQDPAGVFFRTALLEYALYRIYFPVWALGAFEQRRKARATLTDDVRVTTERRVNAGELRSRK